MKSSALLSVFALALLLPACGSSPADDSDDASEGALEQRAGKYKLKDYTMVVSRVAVNEVATEVGKQLYLGGAKFSKDDTFIYVGITEKDAGLSDSDTVHGLACRPGGGDMIEMRCDFYATVKTSGVKETEPGVTQLTIDGKLAKLIAESFSKAGGKEVEAGNLKCTTAGTPKCTMLVATEHTRNLEGFVGGNGFAVVERELSFFYP